MRAPWTQRWSAVSPRVRPRNPALGGSVTGQGASQSDGPGGAPGRPEWAALLPGWARVALPDALAVLWLACGATLFLAPAFQHGTSFGPFDLGLRLSGLAQTLYSHVHNNAIGDQVEEFLPWTLFDWRSLHAGAFPLWNPYAGFGMPQFFNFQSSVLSLPQVVGYAFPPRLAFLAAVACKLLLAGAGAYTFARVAGLKPLAAVFAATAFELGGPFASEVGWPLADVMAWIGWIFAFTLLLMQGRPGRLRWTALLAVSVALSIYGGFPEGEVLLALAWGAWMAAWVVGRLLAHRSLDRGALLAALAGWAGGLCLAAPLWLPGLQLLSLSARLVRGRSPAIPLRALVDWLLQGFYGYPLPPRTYFGPFSYYETVGYIGIPALVLLGVGLLRGEPWLPGSGAAQPRRRSRHGRRGSSTAGGRRSVSPGGVPPGASDGGAVAASPPPHREAAFALVRAAGLLLLFGYATGLFAAASALVPPVGSLLPGRARLPLSFLVAVLAGWGLQEVLAGWERPSVRRSWWLALGAVGLATGGVLTYAWTARGALSPQDAAVRLASFPWAVGLLVCLAATALLTRPGRPGAEPGRLWRAPVLGGVLLVAETLFLASAGAGLNTYGPRFFPVTPAIAQLRRDVGGSLVAFTANGGDTGTYGGVGLIPEMNAAYGIDELAVYDPMLPRSLVAGWARLSGTTTSDAGWFIPAVTNAAIAREVGAGYLLGPAGEAPPAGTVPAGSVGGEQLYRVPGASRFSLLGGGAGAAVASARPVDASTWLVAVHLTQPGQLVARLTTVPGWHAAAGGRNLAVDSPDGMFLHVVLPPGSYTVRLWYWPPLFSAGLALAAAAVLAWAAALVAGRRRTQPGVPSRRAGPGAAGARRAGPFRR
jgi:hypothetical protein